MKRRKFIGWSIVLAGTLTGIFVATPRKLRRDTIAWLTRRKSVLDDRQFAEELRHAFDHLDLDPQVPEKFVADYRRFYRQPVEFPVPDSIKRIFLLSTDFIQQDADESKRVRYTAVYSPYDQPCNNPFTIRRWDREG